MPNVSGTWYGLPVPGPATGQVVDFGAGEDDRRDRAASRSAARPQLRRGHELGPQIGRGVDEGPILAIGGDGEACLRARLDALIATPGQAARSAQAIPLRIAATARRTEDDSG